MMLSLGRSSLLLVLAAAGLAGAFRPAAPAPSPRAVRRAEGPTESSSAAFRVGDKVRVIAEDVTLYHVPGHKKGFDPRHLVGTVTRIATVDRTDPTVTISANRAICVKIEVRPAPALRPSNEEAQS